jgi:hypothetical protein
VRVGDAGLERDDRAVAGGERAAEGGAPVGRAMGGDEGKGGKRGQRRRVGLAVEGRDGEAGEGPRDGRGVGGDDEHGVAGGERARRLEAGEARRRGRGRGRGRAVVAEAVALAGGAGQVAGGEGVVGEVFRRLRGQRLAESGEAVGGEDGLGGGEGVQGTGEGVDAVGRA